MEAVKISPKFQVVIPKRLREALKLSPGQKLQVVAYGNRIEMIPLRKISEMKGFLKEIDTTVEREPERGRFRIPQVIALTLPA
ncbi:AbrB/MazE/SpoVT family DNA-binding domain-containing protein [Syntrophorhabdus aromaticivorans]|jgi:AbrB family looped-hinge helix DNA binding protein|uniref:AbrB/MazE/SpoVT family DNA-binding domain-containing protein n=1 Tax=Syntrophorhabdus aromaticivorans TaxID=328301 RepID=UPI000418B4D0|nr:AbrB/MazE/SpoVT family DNA-binding domain-containing protein [Syntrophorhabdus aromaticivorans]